MKSFKEHIQEGKLAKMSDAQLSAARVDAQSRTMRAQDIRMDAQAAKAPENVVNKLRRRSDLELKRSQIMGKEQEKRYYSNRLKKNRKFR